MSTARTFGFPNIITTKASDILTPNEVYKNTRPATWLTMPQADYFIDKDSEFHILFQLMPDNDNLLAFTCLTTVGEYAVQYTDDTGLKTTNFATSVKCELNLNFNDFTSVTAQPDGTKQVIIKVYARVMSEHLTRFTFEPHTMRPFPSLFRNFNVLEIQCKGSQVSQLTIGGGSQNTTLGKLRYFGMYGANAITNAQQCLRSAGNLIAVLYWDMATNTSLQNTFTDCISLQTVGLRNTHNITTYANAFNNTYGFVGFAPEFHLSFNSAITISNMFNNSGILYMHDIVSTTITSLGSAFMGNERLVTVGNITLTQPVGLNDLFNGCYALESVGTITCNTVTSMERTFSTCPTLQLPVVFNITSLNGSAGSLYSGSNSMSGFIDGSIFGDATSMDGFLLQSYNLLGIDNLKIKSDVSPTNFTDANCRSLTRITLHPDTTANWTGANFNLTQTAMSRQAIINFFNTLPTVSIARTITLSGSVGIPFLTESEKEIATNKGWTLVL